MAPPSTLEWTLEVKRFAAIHPDDPRVDDARRCSEALCRGLRTLEALRLAGVVNVQEAV